jgi:hypothetical protein
VESAILEIRVHPLEVAARVVKVAIAELALQKCYFIQDKALPLEILFPVGFHLFILLIE